MPLWFDLMMAGSGGGGSGTTAILVGANGSLATSTDAIVWTAQTSGFGGADINGVAGQAGTAFIVGANGKISSSTDYATWTARTSGTTKDLLCAAATGSLCVAGGNGGTIVTAATPVGPWTVNAGTTIPNIEVQGLATDGSTWAAACNGDVYYTSTPTGAWTAAGISANVYDIGYSSGIWFIARNNGLYTATTPAGPWTLRQSWSNSIQIDSCSVANGVLFVQHNSNLYISANGASWSSGTPPNADVTRYIFLAGLYISGSMSGTAKHSPNYTTWTAYSPDPLSGQHILDGAVV